MNHRVKKVVGNETRLFYFNHAWQCLEERIGGVVDLTYTWGLRYIDDLVCRDKGAERLYALHDPNWNVVALANTGGTILERMAYSAFGKVNWHDVNFGGKTTSDYGWNRTFTGQVLDTETGLMLYRNRFYHPTLGRFVTRDPIGYNSNGINLYQYCANDSINSIDLLGLIDGRSRILESFLRRLRRGRRRYPPISPTPLPPKYEPPPPPKYDPNFWNDPLIQDSNNCYSYACDSPTQPDGSPRPPRTKPQPGGGTTNDCTSVIAAAKRDGLIDPDECGECPTGWHKVYAVVAPDEDYHWYREDDDGTWSHKRGLGPCTNLDASDNPITDPSQCDRNYGKNNNYTEDCGILCALSSHPIY